MTAVRKTKAADKDTQTDNFQKSKGQTVDRKTERQKGK